MKQYRTFTEEDWQATPEPVRIAFEFLEQQVESLTQRLDELESRISRNSGNSNKPPSSDNPFRKNRKRKAVKKPSGAKKGHKGHTQEQMTPTEIVSLKPECCSCGNRRFPEMKPFYIHQVIELPDIKMDVTHFHLHSAVCPKCGVENRAELPPENRTGFGPRLTALIGDLAGNHGNSRTSNMLDRLMQRMDRHLFSAQYFHGSKKAAELSIRGWTLIQNFAPWNPRTVKKHHGYHSPAVRLNRFLYSECWLENLLISASLGGYRTPPQNPL